LIHFSVVREHKLLKRQDCQGLQWVSLGSRSTFRPRLGLNGEFLASDLAAGYTLANNVWFQLALRPKCWLCLTAKRNFWFQLGLDTKISAFMPKYWLRFWFRPGNIARGKMNCKKYKVSA